MSLFPEFIRRRSLTSQIARTAKAVGVGVVDSKLYVDLDGAGAGLLADKAAHTALNPGTVGGATITAVEYGFGGFINKTVLTLTATPMTVADATAGGGVKIYTFPAGAITILGGSLLVAPTTTSVLASTLNTNVAIEIGVGTATAGAAALTTTEEDIITGGAGVSSTTINVAPVATGAVRTTAPAILDGSGTAIAAYLNLGVPTATDIDGDATVVISGTVSIIWAFGGDI